LRRITLGRILALPVNRLPALRNLYRDFVNPPDDTPGKLLLDPAGIGAAIDSLAEAIAADWEDGPFVFVGIYTRGVTLAHRVASRLAGKGVKAEPVGTLDISLYRDDFVDRGNALPSLETSDFPFEIDGAQVLLFDEVVYTGRTIRAALNGLVDYGRPAQVKLATLVDRGLRELPIQPDYVGHRIATRPGQYVKVRFAEDDGGEEGVFLVETGTGGGREEAPA